MPLSEWPGVMEMDGKSACRSGRNTWDAIKASDVGQPPPADRKSCATRGAAVARAVRISFWVICLLAKFSGICAAAGEPEIYSIQVASYRDAGQAQKEVDRLKAHGLDAFRLAVSIDSRGRWHRIYIGRFVSREAARQAARRLERKKVIADHYIRVTDDRSGVANPPPPAAGPASRNIEAPAVSSIARGSRESFPAGEGASPLPLPARPLSRNGDMLQATDGSRAVSTRKTNTPAEGDASALVIDAITFQKATDDREILSIQSDRVFRPALLLNLDAPLPGIRIEIPRAAGASRKSPSGPTGGRWIREIQETFSDSDRTLRIQLVLTAGKRYTVAQRPDPAGGYEISVCGEVLPPRDGAGPTGTAGEDDPSKMRPIYVDSQGSAAGSEESRIVALVHQWKHAWEQKRIDAYIQFYDRSFRSEGRGPDAWKRHKAAISRTRRRISVDLSDLRVRVQGNSARAFFRQRYRADSYQDVGYKRLTFVRKKNTWRIVQETWYADRPLHWQR